MKTQFCEKQKIATLINKHCPSFHKANTWLCLQSFKFAMKAFYLNINWLTASILANVSWYSGRKCILAKRFLIYPGILASKHRQSENPQIAITKAPHPWKNLDWIPHNAWLCWYPGNYLYPGNLRESPPEPTCTIANGTWYSGRDS